MPSKDLKPFSASELNTLVEQIESAASAVKAIATGVSLLPNQIGHLPHRKTIDFALTKVDSFVKAGRKALRDDMAAASEAAEAALKDKTGAVSRPKKK